MSRYYKYPEELFANGNAKIALLDGYLKPMLDEVPNTAVKTELNKIIESTELQEQLIDLISKKLNESETLISYITEYDAYELSDKDAPWNLVMDIARAVIEEFIRQRVSTLTEDYDFDSDIPNVLYHATYAQFLDSIRENGLGNTTNKMWTDSRSGVVYLAKNPWEAESYAEEAEWLDDKTDAEDYLDNIVILEIDTSRLDLQLLYLDENLLPGGEETYGFEYHGIIPWNACQVFSASEDVDSEETFSTVYEQLSALNEEPSTLLEAKQLGYLSYAIRKSPQAKMSPLKSLETILYTGVIKASVEEDGSNYVSTSRNLLSHLGAGSDWKCALVLDGDKLTNKYKFTPVNYNSNVYFRTGLSHKQLALQAVYAYQAFDGDTALDEYFYVLKMQGSGFLNVISKSTYEVLRTIMNEYNAQEAVLAGGKANMKYQGRTNSDVKKFFDLAGNPSQKPSGALKLGSKMQTSRVPSKYAKLGFDWRCVAATGYNVPNSGLFLKADVLGTYKELILSHHGVDITSSDFFRQLGGSYSDEFEERAVAKLVELVNAYGQVEETETYGLDVSGCIRAILIDDKHRMAFELATIEDLKTNAYSLYLYNDEQRTTQLESKEVIDLAISIREFAARYNIPIILFSKYTTNQEILKELK